MVIRRAALLVAFVACKSPTSSADGKSAPATTTSAPREVPSASSSDAKAARAPTVSDTFTTPSGALTLTPIHHATFLLRLGAAAIYVDPVDEGASYEGLPKADYVFVTDIHPDHMDPAGLARVKKDGTVVVAPPAVSEKMSASIVMKNGDTHDFGAFSVEAVPMYNLTRGPSAGKLFHDKGRGDGYVFTFGKAAARPGGDRTTSRLYVSGDTECTPEMKALRDIDVALVCMNLPYTMPPAEAATCVQAFKPRVLIPFHYRGSNLDELTSAIKPESGVEVRKREWYQP